jgi:lipopolysaccharide transport system permease protein
MSLWSVRAYGRACRDFAGLAYRHRQLTWEMARREITDRYVGQVLGVLWAIAHPLLLMGVYVFVFAFVMKVQVGGTPDMPLDYTAYLLAGLIPWMACSEVMSKAATAITGSANLVKQVVFPLEVLPLKGVLSSLFTQAISLLLLAGYVVLRFGMLPWSYLLLPPLLIMQGVFLVGLACFLAPVGAYLRDLKDVVQVFNVVGIYFVPALYLPTMVPAIFRPFLYCNPFSYLTWCYQDACFFGRIAHPWAWGVLALMALGSLGFGYRVFRGLKPMLGNVL